MTTHESEQGEQPRPFAELYHLSEAEQAYLTDLMVAELSQRDLPDGIIAAWIDSKHPYSGLVRTPELRDFAHIDQIMEPYEESCVFLAMVELARTDEGVMGRVLHGFRVSIGDGGTSRPDSAGTVFMDDLIASDQGFTKQELLDYYQPRGIDATRGIGIETNLRHNKHRLSQPLIPVSQLGYLTMFNYCSEHDIDIVFSYPNAMGRKSLNRAGIQFEPIAGRDDLRTPSLDDDGNPCFDDQYTPAVILVDEETRALFAALQEFACPETVFQAS